MRTFAKRVLPLLLIVVMLTSLCGCTNINKSPVAEERYPIYYCVLNSKGTTMSRVEYEFCSMTQEARIAELFQCLTETDEQNSRYAIIPESIRVEDWKLTEEGELKISFNGDYATLSNTREAILRAGVVLTMAQLDSVYCVSFVINGEELMKNDEPVGPMYMTDYANFIGDPTDVIQVTLCFANAGKNGMSIVTRLVYPDDYKPLEEYLIEFLVGGPLTSEIAEEKKADQKPISTIPEGTRILHLITKNSVCYVDLSSEFEDNSDKTIPAQYILHSIADTLIRNFDYIESVVITIDCSLMRTYRGTEVPNVFKRADMILPTVTE